MEKHHSKMAKGSRTAHHVAQPGAGKGPITIGGRGRNPQNGGGLVVGQACEEAQLHQLRFAGVQGCQLSQRFVKCQ